MKRHRPFPSSLLAPGLAPALALVLILTSWPAIAAPFARGDEPVVEEERPASSAEEAPLDDAPGETELTVPAPSEPQPGATVPLLPPPPEDPAPRTDPAIPTPEIADPELYGKSLDVAAKAVELFGASDDRAAAERVAEIGYRVAREANFYSYPFTFHVVDMPAPNAFALPGGHLFVTRGMLDLGISDDMLAGLLGHEIAHVTRAHGVRMQRRARLMQSLSQALLVGVMVAARNQDRTDRDGIRAPYDPRKGTDGYTASMVQGTAAASLIVSELLLRGYSRDFEREADDEGQRYAAAAGFDPDGLGELMALMETRLPQSKKYGYWQTHPFFEERVRGSQVRNEILTPGRARSADDLRRSTQKRLVAYSKEGTVPEGAGELLETQILLAWPRGPAAEGIRLGRLHRTRDAVLAQLELERDYGALIDDYEEEIEIVEEVDPRSGLLPTLRTELETLQAENLSLYPRAQEILASDVSPTPFLERFLSNYPDAPEVPQVALALGDAYSRLGNQAAAVKQYVRAWEAGPATEQGQRALAGLKNLTPVLDSLAALEQLARQERDPELAGAARARLDQVAGSFKELANGAEYLREYPNGERTEVVTARLNALAEEMYTEVVLYQGVGDTIKALDRINSILTHAPASPAAAQIRDQAVVES